MNAEDFRSHHQNITFPKFGKVVGKEVVNVVSGRDHGPRFDGDELHEESVEICFKYCQIPVDPTRPFSYTELLRESVVVLREGNQTQTPRGGVKCQSL